MIRAYDKTYLSRAQTALGRMLDFAIHDLGYGLAEFFALFLRSGVAADMERGEPGATVGRSGVELAYEVLERCGISCERIKPHYSANRSEEYWTGWALAYYQWHSARSFSDIIGVTPIDEIRAMYAPYHEMDIRQFVDRMNELYRDAHPDTRLKALRKRAGLSQRELSELSGVPLRTIQQYEQRQKSINKAQAEYLVQLSQVLCCNVAALLEQQ